MQPRPQPADDKRPYLQYFLETSITGNFHLGPPGEIYGPFKDDEIAPYVMEHATGLKPKHGEFLKSSQMCGTCHAVALPAVDIAARRDEHPEDELIRRRRCRCSASSTTTSSRRRTWSGSTASTRTRSTRRTRKAKSCQDCHMPLGPQGRPAQDRPPADQDADRGGPGRRRTRTPRTSPRTTTLDVRLRETGYRRHNFAGLNVFLVEMFNQFDDVLGVRKTDFMTGSKQRARRTPSRA